MKSIFSSSVWRVQNWRIFSDFKKPEIKSENLQNTQNVELERAEIF